ncbi:fumarate/nitrate reduction transcriptional regulator Fnr [Thiomicrorhabdus aquaedulcis]|uniref:fumarate/nitrate reduction transcriptional regulator Fnr n=1 Tax=Thiomicrorhabdus aquaedulcis TaxID=2211106 RepID=UPI000FDAC159|nr:fumarate/nitrate reduction transcriptional regulator Fnr [Thiomicrorhabdus aquaedulcis]
MNEIKSAFNVGCLNCGLQKICFPTGLQKSEIDRLDEIVERKSPLKKGQHLFSTGDVFSSLFAIRAGVVKVYSYSDVGEEVIHGFYLPGDVIGVEAVATKTHHLNAIALDATSVCALPFDELSELSLQIPHLNQQMFTIMSKEVNEGRIHAEMLTKRNADQRVAQFIWDMAERYRNRGYFHKEFRLGILHRDVAVYLGLTPETVSRILAKLHQDQIATWKKKEVVIHNESKLRALAGLLHCDLNYYSPKLLAV